MAKIGIESFLLDCHTNDNISEIEAEYGVKGFAVVVRLWQKIYSEKGYYCEWTERSPLLFLSNWFGGNSGVTINLIVDIVSRCLENGIFDAGMYENYSILTSARIQTQYFDVVKRRETILVEKEYLLVSVAKIKGVVYKNNVSVCKNQKNVCRNDTSKVKGSKAKEIKNTTYSCPEPETPSQDSNIQIPLNDNSFYVVPLEKISEWKEAFPAVDIELQLKRMISWCNANPKRRKTKRGIQRFIVNWLSDDQDKGGKYYSGNKKELESKDRNPEPKQEPVLEEELVGDDEEWWKCGLNAVED